MSVGPLAPDKGCTGVLALAAALGLLWQTGITHEALRRCTIMAGLALGSDSMNGREHVAKWASWQDFSNVKLRSSETLNLGHCGTTAVTMGRTDDAQRCQSLRLSTPPCGASTACGACDGTPEVYPSMHVCEHENEQHEHEHENDECEYAYAPGGT